MTQKSSPFTVFLDTEFTNLKSVSPRLISVGLVAEDGRECYLELSDNYQIQECSEYVVQTVLPLLEGGDARMLSAQAASRIQAWIESLGEVEVILRTDAPRYDWALIAELFQFYGCWPLEVRNEEELVLVAKLARRLLLGQTTLDVEFPGYTYCKEDWLREQKLHVET